MQYFKLSNIPKCSFVCENNVFNNKDSSTVFNTADIFFHNLTNPALTVF